MDSFLVFSPLLPLLPSLDLESSLTLYLMPMYHDDIVDSEAEIDSLTHL